MPQRSNFGVVAVLIAVFGFGCSTQTSDKQLRPVTASDAQQLVVPRNKLLGLAGSITGAYVDCRPAEEFRAGHIPGAISLPYERVSIEHKSLQNYDTIVVYGGDYNDPRATGMSKRLMELGHSDVRTLIGGLRAWKANGGEVTAGD